jgi:hypothetical protein
MELRKLIIEKEKLIEEKKIFDRLEKIATIVTITWNDQVIEMYVSSSSGNYPDEIYDNTTLNNAIKLLKGLVDDKKSDPLKIIVYQKDYNEITPLVYIKHKSVIVIEKELVETTILEFQNARINSICSLDIAYSMLHKNSELYKREVIDKNKVMIYYDVTLHKIFGLVK